MIECLPRKVDEVDGFFKICISDMKIREKDLLEDEVSPQVFKVHVVEADVFDY